MSERPEYVPRTWTQGRVNRAFQADPRRVVSWFIVVPALTAALRASRRDRSYGARIWDSYLREFGLE